jgi:GH15 family glucan-1,4-alpha-glucosidase
MADFWKLERYDNDLDYPAWRETDQIFRLESNALAIANEYNGYEIDSKNRKARDLWEERKKRFDEDQALVAAGLRIAYTVIPPGEFVEITELGLWDSQWRVAAGEFRDKS